MRKGRDAASDLQRERPSPEQREEARVAAERVRKMRKGKRLDGLKPKELIAEGRQ